MSVRGRTIGGWRAGALHCRVAEERIDKTQGRPKVVGCVDEGEPPSNATEEPCRGMGTSTHGRGTSIRCVRELRTQETPRPPGTAECGFGKGGGAKKANPITTLRQQCQDTGTVV